MKTQKSELLRMDNVGIIVNDLEAAITFFVELGLEIEGKTSVEGPWVDNILGLDNVRSDIVMMKTPDGHSRLELSRFRNPKPVNSKTDTPVNTIGISRIMFAVTDINEVIARLQKHGARLVGEVVRFEDMYLLCYIRGPEGIIIALAEQLSNKSVTDILET
jgi:catechol 2,3-dioxygenase-like lactoylglutathione lyase family enzyme